MSSGTGKNGFIFAVNPETKEIYVVLDPDSESPKIYATGTFDK